ncbi:hypothetical protein C1I99_28300 [Micromonospora deserti]|uniref:DUF3153 domain-containing protein n=1 Tax=Micromonospora deserti TaxID=2070366 RepID=A0A2W2BHH6_9ACTN|nr:hypothetical protein C1I99_28300 [Micromonospora deserti]
MLLSVGVVAVAVVAGVLGADDDSTLVPPPTATERADTVPLLARAAATQGICYGWRLEDGLDVVSVGSNLGDGVAVADDPRCPRWAQVVADITYTAESSEANDYASVRIEGSADLERLDLITVDSGLDRFGLTEDAFLDDPGWAVTRAAVSLPLLLAETGAVSPAPVATAAPAAAPSPLPDAGSDLWRDRWGYFLGAAGLLLVTALLVTVGLVLRRRQRTQRAAGPARGQRRGGGTRAAGRTPERA